MKIALIGYGKMGKMIESVSRAKSHEVCKIISIENSEEVHNLAVYQPDVAIEFSTPASAFENIKACIDQSIPVVCGTTAWLDKIDEIKEMVAASKGAFFYAPNYSIGVNIFFHTCARLAKVLNTLPQYSPEIEEIHHTEKLDEPSGTAIALAERILSQLDNKDSWALGSTQVANTVSIIAHREDNVPGTHTLSFSSDIDTIQIKHTAHNRLGFAQGAVLAAEWLIGKQGIFGMDDLLRLEV